MKTFQQIGTEIGALVERKNAAYGSSFAHCGAAFRLLYPNGIAPGQIDDALVLVRIWDKMQRIATDRDALGESPFQDIAGYGILGVAMHQGDAAKEGVDEQQCGSVNDAEQKSPEHEPQSSASSVAPSAAAPITTIASAPSELSSPLPSTPPFAPSFEVAPVTALSATEAAQRGSVEDVLELAASRNRDGLCAGCARDISKLFSVVRGVYIGRAIYTCTQSCVDILNIAIMGACRRAS